MTHTIQIIVHICILCKKEFNDIFDSNINDLEMKPLTPKANKTFVLNSLVQSLKITLIHYNIDTARKRYIKIKKLIGVL